MKRDKILYWVTTGLISSAMLTSAFMYLTKHDALVAGFNAIGLPLYFLAILGVAKLAGAVMLLVPAWDRLKEWAYAGFAFTFIGAAWIHLATGTPWMAPLVFLFVLALSYTFRLRIR
ncbi:MAG TPA: DoxX family protein [Chryseosolibacter sp.]|nr:DoxX family protein [Chryseosolibacter sp.]